MPIKIVRKGAPAAPSPVQPPAPSPPAKRDPRMDTNFDSECRAAVGASYAAAIQWFMMASYLYYVHHVSLLSDELYDMLAAELASVWDDFDHPHKRCITRDDLEAGTLYALQPQQYPTITRSAAVRLAALEWNLTLPFRHDGE